MFICIILFIFVKVTVLAWLTCNKLSTHDVNVFVFDFLLGENCNVYSSRAL